MSTLVMILTIALAAVVVAWVVNSIVAMMSGDRPDEMTGEAGDIFLRVLAVLELGFLGRLLDQATGTPWVRRLLYCGALIFVVRAAADYWVHH